MRVTIILDIDGADDGAEIRDSIAARLDAVYLDGGELHPTIVSIDVD